ncbi:hypothetical protein CLOM_g2293 [Closterium sp. NIES-68]|nr:hypothetical protein CLOM_g2293 [Closterium sp. NIES-68]GJP84217.1 hypothetical protein CLOP_g14304 [Closterium sp. NIES-67]
MAHPRHDNDLEVPLLSSAPSSPPVLAGRSAASPSAEHITVAVVPPRAVFSTPFVQAGVAGIADVVGGSAGVAAADGARVTPSSGLIAAARGDQRGSGLGLAALAEPAGGELVGEGEGEGGESALGAGVSRENRGGDGGTGAQNGAEVREGGGRNEPAGGRNAGEGELGAAKGPSRKKLWQIAGDDSDSDGDHGDEPVSARREGGGEISEETRVGAAGRHGGSSRSGSSRRGDAGVEGAQVGGSVPRGASAGRREVGAEGRRRLAGVVGESSSGREQRWQALLRSTSSYHYARQHSLGLSSGDARQHSTGLAAGATRLSGLAAGDSTQHSMRASEGGAGQGGGAMGGGAGGEEVRGAVGSIAGWLWAVWHGVATIISLVLTSIARLPACTADLFARQLADARANPKLVLLALKGGGAAALTASLCVIDVDDRLPSLASIGVWAVVTVDLVFEANIGLSLGKGVNRTLGTLLAGMLALLVTQVAPLLGGLHVAVLLLLVFLGAAIPIYYRNRPPFKDRWTYAMTIMMLTFHILLLSTYRHPEKLQMPLARFTMIVLGFLIAALINLALLPAYAGDTLHALLSKNFDSAATLLSRCVEEYERGTVWQHVPTLWSMRKAGGGAAGTGAAGGAGGDDKMHEMYHGIVMSDAEVDKHLAALAFEPPHGRFFSGYPWHLYDDVTDTLRCLVYDIIALDSSLRAEIQAPLVLRRVVGKEMTSIAEECRSTLAYLAQSVRSFSWAGPPESLFRAEEAAMKLQHRLSKHIGLILVLPPPDLAHHPLPLSRLSEGGGVSAGGGEENWGGVGDRMVVHGEGEEGEGGRWAEDGDGVVRSCIDMGGEEEREGAGEEGQGKSRLLEPVSPRAERLSRPGSPLCLSPRHPHGLSPSPTTTTPDSHIAPGTAAAAGMGALTPSEMSLAEGLAGYAAAWGAAGAAAGQGGTERASGSAGSVGGMGRKKPSVAEWRQELLQRQASMGGAWDRTVERIAALSLVKFAALLLEVVAKLHFVVQRSEELALAARFDVTG